MNSSRFPVVIWLASVLFGLPATSAQDWTQWGGTSHRNNTHLGAIVPDDWEIGEFVRRTGEWIKDDAKNIKWVAKLGSQTYGTPIVADGRIFVGTNNGAGYLKRYPNTTDVGCMLCFRESDGKFLWQHSSEKLPSGRVHDMPMQGIVSSPLVEGNRMWFVTSRGEVACLDTEGYYDGEDDGPEPGGWAVMFRGTSTLTPPEEPTLVSFYDRTLYAVMATLGVSLQYSSRYEDLAGKEWTIRSRNQGSRIVGRLILDGSELRFVEPSGGAKFVFNTYLTSGLDDGHVSTTLRALLTKAGLELPAKTLVTREEVGTAWTVFAIVNGDYTWLRFVVEDSKLTISKAVTIKDQREADVVWKFDMMKELGVRQHNLATCSITSWGDTIFVGTSNGVDQSHINLPAPDAPSFLAMNKHTGKVLWTDNSPGHNLLHGQWSSPAVGELGGVPQVIVPGGDGWVYSFHAEESTNGKPTLLWKFDINPKEAKWVLGGRGTRTNIMAIPVIYEGLVYVSGGQDPEHGEGAGHLWCIDPTKRGDVSSELAMKRLDGRLQPIPHRKRQAVIPDQGEIAVDNPNSAVVWHYDKYDLNGNGEIEFEEIFHRTVSSVVIKNDLLFVSDFSGVVHCINAKTGRAFWTFDMLAASWGTGMIAGDNVYIGDEDGDITIFRLSADPAESFTQVQSKSNGKHSTYNQAIREINMANSAYSTPVVANGVLYIANKTHLFAIANREE